MSEIFRRKVLLALSRDASVDKHVQLFMYVEPVWKLLVLPQAIQLKDMVCKIGPGDDTHRLKKVAGIEPGPAFVAEHRNVTYLRLRSDPFWPLPAHRERSCSGTLPTGKSGQEQ